MKSFCVAVKLGEDEEGCDVAIDRPLVSVVITCYNYGKFLKGCLESVLTQTFRNFEVIIVNDGSTDETDNVMREFCGEKRIRYISQGNQGQAKAKNVGIASSSGEFIAFLDADDLWTEGKLEMQMPLFSDDQVGVVYSRARYIGEAGEDIVIDSSDGSLKPKEGFVTRSLFFDNFVPFSSSTVRKGCFQEFGVFDTSLEMAIDWDLWLRISTKYKFKYVDEPLLFYRIGHAGQMSKKGEMRQRCSDRIMKSFLEKFPGRMSPEDVRLAWSYTYCCRGYYFRGRDTKRSMFMYFRALRNGLFNLNAWRGLAKTLVYPVLGRWKRLLG